MRKGWKYKKLGEIITPAKVIKNGDRMDYPILSITMRSGIILQNERFKKTIASVDTSNYKVVQNGQLVIAFPIDEGLIYTQDIVEAGIMSPAYNIWNVDYSEMNRRFLVTYLHSPYAMSYYKSKLRGTTMRRRSIPKADLLNLTVPFPSLDKQVKIIEELDKINELIRLKEEQLKDFDNLAQSLFYEMFGDPVENEKGWEVKKLGEICEIFAGGDKPKDMCEIQNNEYIYPVIANGEGEKGILGYTKNCRVTKEAVTIGARGASIGNCRIVKNGFTPAIRLLTLIPTGSIDCCFLYYFVKDLNYKQNGAGQAQLTVPNIKCEFIPLPPLSLQHLFAQRIEQIEREKSEVQKSIQDLETLLASRMQYWFE